MSTEALSPLRRRMVEDMTIRQFGMHTQRDYIRQVREFTTFLCCPPDRAEPENLRRYQLHLASIGASYPAKPDSDDGDDGVRLVVTFSALRIGFVQTRLLDRSERLGAVRLHWRSAAAPGRIP